MFNAREWSQQCWKSYGNGSNIVPLRFGNHRTKEMLRVLAQNFDWFQTLRNSSQQYATTCHNMQQGVEADATLTSNIVASVCYGGLDSIYSLFQQCKWILAHLSLSKSEKQTNKRTRGRVD